MSLKAEWETSTIKLNKTIHPSSEQKLAFAEQKVCVLIIITVVIQKCFADFVLCNCLCEVVDR